MKFNFKLSFVILLIAFQPVFSNQSIKYEEKKGKQIIVHSFNYNKITDGLFFNLKSIVNGREIKQTFMTNIRLNTIKWTFECDHEKTKVQAIKQGTKILLTGVHKNKKINKKFKIGDTMWNQLFHIGLKSFIQSKDTGIKFYSIGSSGIGDMKIARFKASKQNNEQIALQGQSWDSVYVNISMTGLKSMFWKGHYWFDQKTGLFLKYGNKGEYLKSNNTIELIFNENKIKE